MELQNIQLKLPKEALSNIEKIFKKIDTRIMVENSSDFIRYCILNTIQKKPNHNESTDLLLVSGDLCRFLEFVKKEVPK